MAEIGISYGALSDPIEDQLNEQGYTLGEKAELVEKMVFGLIAANIHSVLTDSEYTRALDRLHKKVIKDMKPVDEGV